MILCSLHCYLNVVTQLLTKEELLNAQYYILDLRDPVGVAIDSRDHLEFDEDKGKYVGVSAIYNDIRPATSEYNIIYDAEGKFDPMHHCSILMNGSEDRAISDFINKINQNSVLYYMNSMFKTRKGNCLQIAIFYSDRLVKYFGHITCEYISKNFGYDIKFIDPMYRKSVHGRFEYKGDKAFAEALNKSLEDWHIIDTVRLNVENNSKEEAQYSLYTTFRKYTWEDMIHAYELLFPDDPLPPGNYTTEQLVDIVVGKATLYSKNVQNGVLQNLYTTNSSFMNYLDDDTIQSEVFNRFREYADEFECDDRYQGEYI